jgi:hypothetical protein
MEGEEVQGEEAKSKEMDGEGVQLAGSQGSLIAAVRKFARKREERLKV